MSRSLLDRLRESGAALSRVTERWVPDAWVILMSLTVVALLLAVTGGGASIPEAGLAWGAGVWTLLELAMQFSIIMVAAHACASSPPMYRMLDRLAGLPNPERPVQAVALAAGFSMAAGYLNWAFGLVGSALFVPFILKRNPRADVRLVIAAAYMGIGTVWQSGLSSSAPLIMATPGNPLLEPGAGAPVVDRLYPVTETLFHPFNLGYAVAMLLVGLVAAMALHPHRDAVTLTEAEVDEILPAPPPPARADGGRTHDAGGHEVPFREEASHAGRVTAAARIEGAVVVAEPGMVPGGLRVPEDEQGLHGVTGVMCVTSGSGSRAWSRLPGGSSPARGGRRIRGSLRSAGASRRGSGAPRTGG